MYISWNPTKLVMPWGCITSAICRGLSEPGLRLAGHPRRGAGHLSAGHGDGRKPAALRAAGDVHRGHWRCPFGAWGWIRLGFGRWIPNGFNRILW